MGMLKMLTHKQGVSKFIDSTLYSHFASFNMSNNSVYIWCNIDTLNFREELDLYVSIDLFFISANLQSRLSIIHY